MRRAKAMTYGHEISAQLAGCERSADTGLIAQARLLATLLEARLGLGMAACVQNDLVQETGSIIAHGLARREQLLKIHAALSGVGEKLGVDVRAFGDGGDKEENIVAPLLTLVPEAAQAA